MQRQGELIGRAFSLRPPRARGCDGQCDLPRMFSGAWMQVMSPVEGTRSDGTEVGGNGICVKDGRSSVWRKPGGHERSCFVQTRSWRNVSSPMKRRCGPWQAMLGSLDFWSKVWIWEVSSLIYILKRVLRLQCGKWIGGKQGGIPGDRGACSIGEI